MRKLAIAAFCFAVAIFISRYFLPHEWLLLFSAGTAVISLSCLFFRGNMRKRMLIAFIAIAVGFAWSWVYTTIFIMPYRELHDEAATVTAVVADYPVVREPRGYRVDASLRKDGIPSVGVRFYYNDEAELKPGDIISVTAKFRRADITDEGDRLDILSSRGLFLTASVSGGINIIGSENGLLHIPKRLAARVAMMIDSIYPEDVSHFMQALLMGKRDELFRDAALSASLSASGIIHIVSISGMHISFLMGFLALVIRSKRLFAFYSLPALIFFMAMTGFTPAVSRAGIMQVFLICAPIFKRESDSITSLSAALLALLAANPYSIASVGLQLSFSATLGIIIFTGKINAAVSDSLRGSKFYKKKIPRTITNFIISSLATTIGALIFTLPLTAIHFGYVSLVAPITNLFTIGAVSLAFPIGLITALLGFITPQFGAAVAFPVAMAARYIIYVARILSSVPYSIVYSSNAYIMLWLAYTYVMFTMLPLLKARARQYIYPICIVLIMLFAVILITPLASTVNADSVTVLNVGQGLSVVITADNYTMVVDCGSLNFINAGEVAHEFIMSLGRTSIDLLAITHYHEDHLNGVEFLLSRVAVSALLIPDPEGSFLAEDIIELARKRGVDIIYVTETLSFMLGETHVFVYPPLGIGCENERGISILTLGNISALITGDMNSTTERALLRHAALPKVDLLVVGHHGSRHSTSDELLYAISPEIAVIPVGRNSFGHPAPEVLQRLKKHGVVVYRSDEDGHVTVYGG